MAWSAPGRALETTRRAQELCTRALELLRAEATRTANVETVLVTIEALRNELDKLADELSGQPSD